MACRHLPRHFIMGQMPSHHNAPVNSNVRHQLLKSENFVNTARRRRLASQIQPTLRQVSEATLHSFKTYCVQCLSVHPHKSFPPALMRSPSITKRCCLTGRSTGPIAAGRHLGYKSLAQTPARRNRPVSLYVRHQLSNSANFVNTARRRRLASQIQPTLRQVSEATDRKSVV